MSTNNYRPHVVVLPEDDANRQLVNGFLLDPFISTRKLTPEDVCGGWERVIDCFLSYHVALMERYRERHVILLMDFDDHADRGDYVKSRIPPQLADRVYVLGVSAEPENLKAALRVGYEEIGMKLAQDCREGTDNAWSHPLLQHNATELERLRNNVQPILFPD
ncbi:MAG: hypothetical protein WDO18_16680 [Acidobacteriota bacterium]